MNFLRRIVLILLLVIGGQNLFSAPVDACSEAENGFGMSKPGDSLSRPKNSYHTQFTELAPVVDGKLNDDCWKQGEWQSNYTQFAPTYRAQPSRKTELKILYNDKSIFVAIRAYDDIEKGTRRLSRRDSYAGDIVGIHLDSYHDLRTAFEFDLTSAGQKIDVWVSNDGWDTNWNAIWYGKVAYEDSAWTAEMEIPLSQLRYGSSDEQVWGLNAWRKIDRLQEEEHWNLVANDGTGLVYTFGELHGLKNLKKHRRIELAPYVSGQMTSIKGTTGNPFTSGAKWNGQAGLDAKIGITNNFTLDATINPDFGQVEADPSVMNLTAFETYFEEKRPFFVEGKSIFDFTFDSDKLFYTRRIGHSPSYAPGYDTISMPEFTTIGGAFKLSGKTANGLSIGIIESLAMKEQATIRSNGNEFNQDVEPLTNYFIGRFQKDFDKGSTIIGGILTHTHRDISSNSLNFLSHDALTYGLDFTKYWVDRKYVAEVKAIGSAISGDKEAITRLQTSSARYFQRPELATTFDTTLTALNGLGASAKIGKGSKGHWRYNEEIVARSAGLELNELGYMTMANYFKNSTNIEYYETENTSLTKNYSFSFQQQNGWNMQGNSLYSLISLGAGSEFMNSWSLHVTGQHKFRTTDERLLRGGPAMEVPNQMTYALLLLSNSSRKIYLTFYANGGYCTTNKSNYVSASATLSYRPMVNLVLSLQPSYMKNLDALQYIGQFSTTGLITKYLLGTVDNRNLGLTFRADLALTPELTIQYYASPFVSIGKYNEFKEVTNPVADEYNDRFTILTPNFQDSFLQFDNNNDNTIDYQIYTPDFNYQQFKSNLVLRWEYKAGSTLYFVWAQDRTQYHPGGAFNLNEGFRNLSSIAPRNILMVKFNYWFSI